MYESKEYRDTELHKQKMIYYRIVNGLLTIVTFHYIGWLLYKLGEWLL